MLISIGKSLLSILENAFHVNLARYASLSEYWARLDSQLGPNQVHINIKYQASYQLFIDYKDYSDFKVDFKPNVGFGRLRFYQEMVKNCQKKCHLI